MPIYKTLTIILTPLISVLLFFRRLNGKEDAIRYKERMGYASVARPEGKVVWFHAASVGESVAILPIAKKLAQKHSDIHVLFTTTTVTGASYVMKQIFPEDRIIHQYVPVDQYFSVKRFFAHWKPDLSIFTESEIWPNLIVEAKKSGCKLISINSKMSEKSYKKWKLLGGFSNEIINSFVLFLPQSEEYNRYIRDLGAKKTIFLGNLKFDVPALKVDSEQLEEIANMTGNRKIWVAASTHPGEEEIIAQLHNELVKFYPDLLTILIPRHPKRKDEILKILNAHKIKVAVRSENKKIEVDTGIYLADTMGELGIFFELSDLVFMGGSLVDGIGGHTPVEPAKLHCTIVTGKYIKNNSSLFMELEKHDACIIVNDKKELVAVIKSLFYDKTRRQKLSENAYNLVTHRDNISDKIIEIISEFL